MDNQVKASFTASSLVCHPEGAVFLALSEKGLVQCFDAALTPVQLCFPNEEQVTSTVLHLTVAPDCHYNSNQTKNGETVTLSTSTGDKHGARPHRIFPIRLELKRRCLGGTSLNSLHNCLWSVEYFSPDPRLKVETTILFRNFNGFQLLPLTLAGRALSNP